MAVAVAAALALTLAFSAAPSRAATVIDVTFDGSYLLANPGSAPFGIFFSLTDGDASSNSVQVSDFNFAGGGSPILTGGASGSLAAGVSLTDTLGYNDLTEGFTPVGLMTFTITIAEPIGYTGGAPDRFFFGLLTNFGTVDEDVLMTDDPDDGALLVIDLKPRLTNADLRVFGPSTDPLFPPQFDFLPPTATIRGAGVIPEPASLAMAGLGLVGLAGLAFRSRRRAA
jgi:MYXO-CTERM domain-containing protein